MPRNKELEDFDWFNHKCPWATPVFPGPKFLMFDAPPNEPTRERQLRMLQQVRNSCMACTMCELGRRGVCRDGQAQVLRDPHVFSNMNPSPFMVVGQNPGWNEVVKCVPFVGAAGANFDEELLVNSLDRSDFYICNSARCYTQDNQRPLDKHLQRCRPFLEIEINLLRPLLVVALGAVAFERFCPGVRFDDGLGAVTASSVFEDVNVFAIYHPSPLNLKDEARAKMFKKQMRVMCALVKRLKEVRKV